MDEKIVHNVAVDDRTSSTGVASSLKNETGAVFAPTEDPALERKLTTKLDITLVPMLGLIYLIMFLDRTNIANARIQGLEKGLNMPLTGFNTCLWIFYLPFVIAEIPSNIILSLPQIRPRYFLGAQLLILGVCSMCQGLTHSYHGLLACRFLMGIFEAGLPAGAALLISSYYTKKQMFLRYAVFFAFAQAGPCFSGLLAYAIVGMNGLQGYAGWRWIFILEGIVTIAISIAGALVIPDFPQTAKFITEDERHRLIYRLQADRGVQNQGMKVNWFKTFFDYKIWLLTLMFFCCDMSAASISSFTPTILVQLGWQARRAQVMTMPVWISGMVVELGGCYLSSKMNRRWPFVLGGLTSAMIGWIIQYVQVPIAGVRYFALFLMASGTFIQFPILLVWLSSNLRGRPSLALGTAIQLGIGNCANFVASNVFITKEAPKYPTGFGTGLGLTVAGMFFCFLAMGLFMWHNKKLDAKIAAMGPEDEPLDDQVDYHYVL